MNQTKRGGKRVTSDKMTKWEAANVLTGLADDLGDKESDLRNHGFKSLAAVVHVSRMMIGGAFNEQATDVFTLPSYHVCTCQACREIRRITKRARITSG